MKTYAEECHFLNKKKSVPKNELMENSLNSLQRKFDRKAIFPSKAFTKNPQVQYCKVKISTLFSIFHKYHL